MALEVRDLARTVLQGAEERSILRDLSFAIDRGERLGLTGPSGSGKTSLLRLIVGLDARSAGTVRLDGQDLEDLPATAFRRRVAMVPQDVPEWPMTPEESLRRCLAFRCRLGSDPDARAEALFAEHLEALDLGDGTRGRPWRELSGGQRRRTHAALAAALQPDYLLLDEPGAGLDREAGRHLALWMRTLGDAGIGVVFAAHDELLLARAAQVLIVLFDGEMHAEGPPSVIIPSAVEAVRSDA